MTRFSLPYAHYSIDIDLNHGLVDQYLPLQQTAASDPDAEIERALQNTVDGFNLEHLVGAKTAAIAINDRTRPTPLLRIIKPLVGHLNKMGILNQNITLLVATGTHAPESLAEIQKLRNLLGADLNILSHNCDDTDSLTFVGETTRGTPVFINKKFIEAEIRIVTGNVEPHHFMGFSGGVKTACIGLAGRETIRKNHSMLRMDNTGIGIVEENPMRQDVEEMGRMAKIQFALNTILTDDFQIVRGFAGHPENVYREAIALSRQLCEIEIPFLYDLVIASAGGYPKDINLYQSQKAISHAALFTRPGGTILLAAACTEGLGSQKYEQFMRGVHSKEEVFEKISRTGFEIGFHKALQIALQLEKYRVILVSELSPTITQHTLLTPAVSLEQGLDMVRPNLSPLSHIAILPFATHLIASCIQPPAL